MEVDVRLVVGDTRAWRVGVPTVLPLTLGRARVVIPESEYAYGDAW